ncbi:NAD(P)/FAD-dependent oxidoreductase [Pseudonocardia parietis]|uniref:NADPH-dependent 2,4-dienoyl-CoA reductase/sulfur reductase-like enzyme n=1 Tax=Pseudonocardia parietis TaxID=570936 RepID=A0ABS4VV64_9PSEU|nr:FAD-dependent oxidoreductase [Pseudonocardia parietis]MBP2367628.1 NADPH-dependent 2,4-dienoyl-CoA reductase/sulfur reductase-like enzyme [Pseudonocardia parietis]
MTPQGPRLVIVGASLAGLRAAEAARDAGHEGPVTLVGAESHLPYDRPPLSKAYLDEAAEPAVHFREERHLRDALGIDLVLGEPASGLEPDTREVLVGARRIPYDGLVIATGARARLLPGAEGATGVQALRTLDDAIAVRAALDAGARTVVIGAGFIGSEVASAARKRGLPVTIVEAQGTPLVRAIGSEMGTALSALHAAHGTDLRCGVGVAGVESADGRVTGVRLTDGTTVPADLVVAGIGADPATGWLEGSGVEVDNGVVADETLATALPGVYAAGDVVRWRNPLFDDGPAGGLMRIEHWTSAAEQGAVAARNALLPAAAAPYQTVPYFWSDWYSSRIQFVGVPAADEVTVVSGSVDEQKFVALYRTGDRLTGALTLDRRADVMKYRAQIAKRTTWDDALAFAEKRNAAAAVSS